MNDKIAYYCSAGTGRLLALPTVPYDKMLKQIKVLLGLLG